jgi:nitroreductase
MKTNRRSFLQTGALLGAGLCLSRSHSLAAEPAAPAGRRRPAALDTIHDCRTIHGNFTEREIPEDTLQEIIDASVRAPGASNMQSYSIIVLRDRQRMVEVCGYAGSRTLVYCMDFTRLVDSARHLGHAYAPGGVDDLLIASVNTTLAIENAVVAARALGVDSLVTNGVHRGDIERHWKLLDLPDSLCVPLLAVVLGYPTEEPTHRTGRLRGAGVVHEDRYHRLTPPELADLVREYDDPQRHLGLNDNWREKHAHYLDWFFGVWMGRGNGRGRDSQLTRVLKRAGLA